MVQLQPLKFDNLEIGFPVVQAALSGYSDWPMRLLARRNGASYGVCEVMLDQFLVNMKSNRKKNKHFLHISDEERPVGGQLMGAEPEQFSAGAIKLVEAGYDVIDINFGCPVKKVLGRCRGGYHLSQPDVALDIIQRTRRVVPAHIPVTIKMRRGIDDTEESRDKFFRILQGAFDIGLAAATVHGRTVDQRYIGPSRWSFLTELKQRFPDRVILGSGDLFEAADCLNMIQETGVDGVTVARGSIGNPWIFSQTRTLADTGTLPPPPTVFEQRALISEHFDLAEQLYGEKRCSIVMRKFCIKYSALHPEFHEVREGFKKIMCRDDWEAILNKWYGEDRPGNYLPRDIHK